MQETEQVQQPEGNPLPAIQPATFRYFPFSDHKIPAMLIAIVAVVFYCTSIMNEYALDDGIIIHQNEHVLKGVQGIGSILTKDAYDSFYKRMNAKDQLQGGRYRPLPTITFAIEQEFIGTYRTGYYEWVADLNNNGVLDDGKIGFMQGESHMKGLSTSEKPGGISNYRENYEYNNYEDLNNDGRAQRNECFHCWDLNRNFDNEPEEDMNSDGVFNEVDCQVYGASVRHFNNIWMYALACVFLYVLLSRYMLRDRADLAFLAALLFAAHPIHSEVVANVKSRDEILSFLFMCLTFIWSYKFIENRSWYSMLVSGLMFLLCLLCKEYGIFLFILIPLALHIFNKNRVSLAGVVVPVSVFIGFAVIMIRLDVFGTYFGLPPFILFFSAVVIYSVIMTVILRYYFREQPLASLMSFLCISALVYLAMRLNAVNMAPGVPDTEVLNNPFLFASPSQAFATKVYILLRYLIVVFVPHPLISDYSFATIAYRDLGDWDFILSAISHIALIAAAVVLCIRRHVAGFAIVSYLLFLVPVTNFFFAVGATMREGLAFHASLGFAMFAGWMILKGVDRLTAISEKKKRIVLAGGMAVILLLYCVKTWERNLDWKNDVTLFLKDVKNAPHSVLVLGNAGARWIDLSDTREITGIPLPGDKDRPFNDYNGTLQISEEDVRKGGFSSKREAALARGIGYIEHAVELHPRYVNGYLNLGLASFKLNKDLDAIYYWKVAELLYPNNPYLANYYHVYTGLLKERGDEALRQEDPETALYAYKLWSVVTPRNADAWYNIAVVNYRSGERELARKNIRKALSFNSNDPRYTELMRTID
jgi:protein O-mannosyl-transferase